VHETGAILITGKNEMIPRIATKAVATRVLFRIGFYTLLLLTSRTVETNPTSITKVGAGNSGTFIVLRVAVSKYQVADPSG